MRHSNAVSMPQALRLIIVQLVAQSQGTATGQYETLPDQVILLYPEQYPCLNHHYEQSMCYALGQESPGKPQLHPADLHVQHWTRSGTLGANEISTQDFIKITGAPGA